MGWLAAIPCSEKLLECRRAVLGLLEGPHDPQELLLAANFVPAPGPPTPECPWPWVHYAYVTARVGLLVRLNESNQLWMIGRAVRGLADADVIDVVYRQQRRGRRVVWLRRAGKAAEGAAGALGGAGGQQQGRRRGQQGRRHEQVRR